MDTKSKIREFILSNFKALESEVGDTIDLLETGVIDSTGITELVFFVEEEFHITVPVEDILPEHFDTIEKLSDYISRRLTEA